MFEVIYLYCGSKELAQTRSFTTDGDAVGWAKMQMCTQLDLSVIKADGVIIKVLGFHEGCLTFFDLKTVPPEIMSM